MTVPTLRLATGSALDIAADVLVIGVVADTDGARIVGFGTNSDGSAADGSATDSAVTDGAEADGAIAELQASLTAIGFSGGKDDVRRVPSTTTAARSIALVGLGAISPGSPGPDAHALRYAAGTAARSIRGAETIAIALPATSDDEVLAILEGAAMGAYAFTEYRSAPVESTARVPSEIVVVARSLPADDLIAKAMAVAIAVHSVRDLVNTPPSDLYPESFAAAATTLAEGLPVDLAVLTEHELGEGGFGGLLGVGQGSSRGPRLVKVSYSPEAAQHHLAIVGKGITFDTGGLSLKPPTSMVGMKYDMTGAATALAVVLAAARLALPVRLTAWLCLAENMPSSTATRPNDVLRIRGGKTVEVLNTDAEGRLVLADGLVAASEEHPDSIVDIATLTGAASVAMGTRYVATMGDHEFVSRVVTAGDRAGENLWHMPLPSELRALLESDVADLANVKIGNTAGGMLIAGVFLREFVGKTEDGSRQIPWAHLDIAGAANNAGGGYGHVGKGPTGVAVRALLELVDELSRG